MSLTFSAGGVVLNSAGQVLVVNQKGVSWSLPKGHIEAGEAPLEAARREITEETGLRDLNCLTDLGSYRRFKIGQDGQDEMDEEKDISMYLFSTNQNELAPQDKDNPEARWLEPQAAVELLTHQRDRQFLSEALVRIEAVLGL